MKYIMSLYSGFLAQKYPIFSKFLQENGIILEQRLAAVGWHFKMWLFTINFHMLPGKLICWIFTQFLTAALILILMGCKRFRIQTHVSHGFISYPTFWQSFTYEYQFEETRQNRKYELNVYCIKVFISFGCKCQN